MQVNIADKNSTIRLMPREWKILTIEQAFEICNNLRFPISEDVRKKMQGVYPYYGPTRIQDHINEFRVDGEYALIGEDGDHFLKWDEMSMTQLAQGKFNVNNHAHLIKGKEGVSLTLWFYFYFKNRDLTQHLTRQGASRYKLSKGALKRIDCAIPPLSEQSAIATALSDVDALITSLEKLIVKKQMVRQGTLQNFVKPKKGWKEKQIGEIGEIDSDNLPSTTSPTYSFKYISLEGVKSGELQSYSEVSFQKASPRARRRLTFKDILISTVRPNLKSHLLFGGQEQNWVCSTGFSVLRCDNGQADPDFVFNLLFGHHITKQIESLISGSNYPAINSKDVRRLSIFLPSIDEQIEIAKILSEMSMELRALDSKLQKYRQIKIGMMQNLLTGKIRLI